MNIEIYSFIFIIIAIDAEKISYEGYKVYDVVARTDNQVRILKELNELGVTMNWDDYVNINFVAKIMVSRENQIKFLLRMNEAQVEVKELISDLQSEIENTFKAAATAALSARSKQSSSKQFLSMAWNRFYKLEDINSWLDRIAYNYRGIVRTVVLGRSFESRNIKGIAIDYNRYRKNKLIAVIEAGIHGREWIGPATATWIIKEFLSNNDSNVNALAKNFEWHIFPVVNPDGYSYTMTHDRLWRKNRNSNYDRRCTQKLSNKNVAVGVDLNRNFKSHWGGVSSSNNPCTLTFAGSKPFSEPETRYLSKYLEELMDTGKIVYYFCFHSYSQSILLPYGHLTLPIDVKLRPSNYDVMHKMAVNGVEKLKQRYGTIYRVGNPAELLYAMSGCSLDWVTETLKVPFVCNIEARDNKTFLLPPEQIVPNCEEIMDFLVGMDHTAQDMDVYVPTFVSNTSTNLQTISTVLNSFLCLFLSYYHV